MLDSVQLRALRLALHLAGDARTLATHLGINGGELFAYLEGREIPKPLFLRIVDFVNDVQQKLNDLPLPSERSQGNARVR